MKAAARSPIMMHVACVLPLGESAAVKEASTWWGRGSGGGEAHGGEARCDAPSRAEPERGEAGAEAGRAVAAAANTALEVTPAG